MHACSVHTYVSVCVCVLCGCLCQYLCMVFVAIVFIIIVLACLVPSFENSGKLWSSMVQPADAASSLVPRRPGPAGARRAASAQQSPPPAPPDTQQCPRAELRGGPEYTRGSLPAAARRSPPLGLCAYALRVVLNSSVPLRHFLLAEPRSDGFSWSATGDFCKELCTPGLHMSAYAELLRTGAWRRGGKPAR